jgi:hypothetical protein
MSKWINVAVIKKHKTGIEWSLAEKILAKQLKQGLYLLVYKDKVIKVGIFGEGNTKSVNHRISAYRSVIKSLEEIRNGRKCKNGSFNTIDTLDKRLNVGDEVIMKVVKAPNDIENDGWPYKVDLYILEKHLKDKYKDTLWLS